jgi:hypothetical protein
MKAVDMANLLDEIRLDVEFIKGHNLQPGWYKVLKVFILIGFFVGYAFFFGFPATLVFFAVFFFLSVIIHLFYRSGTNKWRRSWLDFVVVEDGDRIKTKRIGKYYYSAIVINTVIAIVISQLW